MTHAPLRSFSSSGDRALRSPALTAAVAAVIAGWLPAQPPANQQFATRPSGIPTDTSNTLAVQLCDVDDDGDLDPVLGNDGQNQLFLNDGRGRYVDATATHLPIDTDQTASIALGDVDGDGDVDLVCGNGSYFGSQNRLYLNDGSGAFTDVTASQLPVDADLTTGVALGDVDGDGDLDIVFANRGQQKLYLNDGVGTFTDVTATRLPVASDATIAVVLVDVDGDGDLDCVCGNSWWAEQKLYRNDGSGTFTDVTATHLPNIPHFASSVTAGDIDGDGDADLVLTGISMGMLPIYSQDRLYRNDGSGTFTDVTAQQLPTNVSSFAAFLDFDDDGDLDLAMGDRGTSQLSGTSLGTSRLYRNDGGGHYTDASSELALPAADTRAVVSGDLDGDGDEDLVWGCIQYSNPLGPPTPSPTRLSINLLRHLDAPSPPQPGQPYTLDLYARRAPGLVHVGLPYLALSTASTPLPPFGTFGLDPATTIALPPVLIPQPAGVTQVTIQVPNLPGLVGLPVFGQALVVPWPFAARFTNVTADAIQ